MAEMSTSVLNLVTLSQTELDCRLFNFIMWGCLVMILCYFGYLGNFLTFSALQRDIRNPATTLLQSLAVSDVILLLSVNLTDAIPYVCDYTEQCTNPWSSWPYIRYFWMLTPIGHMCSIWIVILVAANRYWAVCKPHAVADVWSNRRTCIYVIMVVCFSFIFNIPRIFEYEIVDVPNETSGVESKNLFLLENSSSSRSFQVIENHLALNLTALNMNNNSLQSSYSHLNNTPIIVEMRKKEQITRFGKTSLYKVGYKVVIVNILLVILPLPFLFLTSVWIIRSLRVSAERTRSTKSRPSSSTNDSLQETCKSDTKKVSPSKEVTLLLVAVVLVAVACQSPLAIFHFVRFLYPYKCGDVVYYLESGSKLLVTFNSCVNFIVYCVLSPKFRRLLKSFITCKKQRKTFQNVHEQNEGKAKLQNKKTQPASTRGSNINADNEADENTTEMATLISNE